jgi:class 3 adenylate cyclase
VLDASLRNQLAEMICASFKTEEINELGRLLFASYDSHRLSGTAGHISISPRKCANVLVEQCEKNRKIPALIKLAVELDGGIILGRCVCVDGLEPFLHRLARNGYVYNFENMKLVSSKKDIGEMANWGCLKDGKQYEMTVMSLDLVDNSALLRRHGTRTMEKLYYQLWRYLKQQLKLYEGRMWSWAGDGGIMAFTFKDHACRAVRCAISIQSTLAVFNISTAGLIGDDVALRIGLDTGCIKFYADTGRIVSEIINYAAHLEKKSTEPGKISISTDVATALSGKCVSIFTRGGRFENREFFTTYCRLDALLEGIYQQPRSAEQPA